MTVADHERSRRFYEADFGFDAGPAIRYEDGVLIIRDRDGFDRALGEGDVGERPAFVHFGFRADAPAQVRTLRERLAAGEVAFVEDEDTEAYAGFKCLDPDGYRVEVYWEP